MSQWRAEITPTGRWNWRIVIIETLYMMKDADGKPFPVVALPGEPIRSAFTENGARKKATRIMEKRKRAQRRQADLDARTIVIE